MGIYWAEEDTNTLQWKLNNGKMGITSKSEVECSPNRWPSAPSSFLSNNDLYDIGWNFMWYSINDSQSNFINFQHFKSPAKVDSQSHISFRSLGRFSIGGAIITGPTTESFIGIVHSIRFLSSTMTENQIKIGWLIPSNSNAALWDYFTSMFDELDIQDEESTKTMHGHHSYFNEFSKSPTALKSPPDGLKLEKEETWTVTTVSNL